MGTIGKHLGAYPKEELRQQIGRSFSTVLGLRALNCLAIICLLPGSPSLLPSSGRMRARIMTLMLRVCSTLAKHHIQESGLPQRPHNTCQPLWRLPTSLARLFSEETLSHLNVASCLVSAILAVLLIATAPEEFGILSVQPQWKQPALTAHTDGASYCPTVHECLC